jgi:hypothetical protein
VKYVLLKHEYTGAPRIEVGFFPLNHSDMAARLKAEGFKPVRAGFVRVLPDGKFETFGFSTSLKLDSHPDDSRLIAAMFKATEATAPQTTPAAQPAFSS